MYSRERFTNAKSDLFNSMIYLQEGAIESSFLSHLLINLALKGKINDKTINSALNAVWDALECLSESEKDSIIADLQEIGEYYTGRLSSHQRRELSRLYDKCLEYLENPSADLLREIEEML